MDRESFQNKINPKDKEEIDVTCNAGFLFNDF